MSAVTLFEELHREHAAPLPLTVEQYHKMIEAGILPEAPIELIDGFLVRKDRSQKGGDPMTVGHQHAWVIRQLNEMLSSLLNKEWAVQIQLPVTLFNDSEPEPDAAVFRRVTDNYLNRHPGPADIACIFEVADSSLQRDRTTKLRIYADAGIAQYIIINLVESAVEDYREPVAGEGRFQKSQTLRKGEKLQLQIAASVLVEVPIDKLLP